MKASGALIGEDKGRKIQKEGEEKTLLSKYTQVCDWVNVNQIYIHPE